ncbi:MAG: hypothetical protein IJP80_03870 [Bacteroidales bacterium]|nr:hypothetical protein [Bacteroidales bacterium]
MKRYFLLIFALMAVLSLEGMAQSFVVSLPFSDKVENSIVRETTYGNTVSYVETASDHWIVFASTANATVQKLQIPSNIFMTDLFLHDEYVYFCGYDNANSHGVWGWFDTIASKMASNGITYYNNFNCRSCDVERFNALVVYSRGTSLFAALVGSAIDGLGDARACTVSLAGTEGIATGWSYTIGQSPDTAEKLTNICLTDNYVVASGVSDPSYSAEHYRIHNRYSMWDGQADRRYYYACGPVGVIHCWDGFAMTRIGGDTIATAAICHIASSSASYGVLLNVYDMQQTLSALCCIPPVSSVEYDNVGYLGQYQIKNLCYSTTNQIFSILLTGKFNFFTDNTIVAQLLYPGATNIEFFGRNKHTSFFLDHFTNQSRFLVTGRNDINPNEMLYFAQPHSFQGACSNYHSDFLISNAFESKSHSFPYYTCNGQFDCLMKETIPSDETATNSCEAKQ